jgi:hypothetical protein
MFRIVSLFETCKPNQVIHVILSLLRPSPFVILYCAKHILTIIMICFRKVNEVNTHIWEVVSVCLPSYLISETTQQMSNKHGLLEFMVKVVELIQFCFVTFLYNRY